MIYRKNLTALVMGLFLTACGSGGSDSGNTQKSDDQTSGSVGDLAGVWDLSEDAETPSGEYGMDEAYLVITPDGQYYEYDYKGDAFAALWGDNENCYEKSTIGTITKLENGSFFVDISVDDFLFIEQQVDYRIINGELSAPASLLNPSGARVSIPAADNINLDDIQAMECES